jgi:hypothetical protein
MTTRIILAGVLGGIAMFIWSSIAHMALPLGEAGIRELPKPALAALQTGLGEKSGLYLFPGLGVGENATHEQRSEAMKQMGERLARNPSGLLMYYPTGARPLTMGKLLSIEFATELFEAILAVLLLAQTPIASFGGRAGFIFVVGILAAIATNVSYWNWYGFPGLYTAAYIFTQIVGFLCAGLVAALVLRKSALPGTA